MEKYVQEGILKGVQRAWIGEETTFMDRTMENVTKQDTRVRHTTATLSFTATDDMRARIGADDGRRTDGGHIPMTMDWQFLGQRGLRSVRPGERPASGDQTWICVK